MADSAVVFCRSGRASMNKGLAICWISRCKCWEKWIHILISSRDTIASVISSYYYSVGPCWDILVVILFFIGFWLFSTCKGPETLVNKNPKRESFPFSVRFLLQRVLHPKSSKGQVERWTDKIISVRIFRGSALAVTHLQRWRKTPSSTNSTTAEQWGRPLRLAGTNFSILVTWTWITGIKLLKMSVQMNTISVFEQSFAKWNVIILLPLHIQVSFASKNSAGIKLPA